MSRTQKEHIILGHCPNPLVGLSPKSVFQHDYGESSGSIRKISEASLRKLRLYKLLIFEALPMFESVHVK